MQIATKNVENVIQDNMMNYGAYVIFQRALPDIRDGLKPGQRRILYTLLLEKATKFTKSANIDGAVMKLHPHGSSYDTMVKMAQKDRQHNPLVVGKGSFGNVSSKEDTPAAARYTEVKLSEMAYEALKDLNKNLVDFVPNYDGTMTMPEVLPTTLPWILTMPSKGVAYTMASDIPSFNPTELCNAIIKHIREGVKTLLIPDFKTGANIVNDKEAFKNINLKGSGSFNFRAKAEIVGQDIIITELPFNMKVEDVKSKTADLVKSGKLSEITAIKDLSDLKGLKIKITAKRRTDMKLLLEKLYQFKLIQASYSANMNVIINGRPKVLGVWPIIEEWTKWRKETLVRGFKFDIEKMSNRLHFLKGLEKVLVDIDKAIEIIRRSEEDLIDSNLMKEFEIDEKQASSISNMKLRNINKDYIIKQIRDIAELELKIIDLKDLISKDERLNEEVIKGLEEAIVKYGAERKSKLIEVNTEKIKAAKKVMEKVPNYMVKLMITKQGYVKKLQTHAERDNQYLKPGDEIVQELVSYNDKELLVFGTDRCCHKIKINDIEDHNARSLGAFIPSLCEVKDIVGVSVLDDIHKFIMIGYDNNKVAKIKLSSFEGNRKKLANSLADNANVIGILTFKDEGTFMFKTTKIEEELKTSDFDAKDRWTKGSYGPRKGIVKAIVKN